MSENFWLIVLMYGLVLAFYVPFLMFFRKRMKVKFARRRFYRGVTSVLENCPNDSECVPQIQMLYKRLSARYSPLSETFRSTPEIIEDLICSINTSDPKEFKEFFRIEPSVQLLPRIVNILNLMKALQPYSSLSSKEANLLNTLNQAIDTGNAELARNSLSQVADGVEVLEESLRRQYKRTQFSFTISTVGIILTAFFGIVAFIQFLPK